MPSASSRYWDTVAEHWQTHRPQRLWRRYCDSLNRRLLEPWLPGPAAKVQRLLKTDLFDEAGGEGLAPLLHAAAEQVVGIDISSTMLQPVRTNHPRLRAVAADVRRLPFADAGFDVIVSNSTLDHFERVGQIAVALTELRRVLKPGGELLLTLDNGANPVVALRNALPRRLMTRCGVVPYEVGATCGPGRLKRMLEAAGLRSLESRAIMHCPRIAAVAAARLLTPGSETAVGRAFISGIMAMELLERLPTRYFTGYFVAVRARRN